MSWPIRAQQSSLWNRADPKCFGGAHWNMEWIKWKIEYDNQVYRNNFNEHVAITEVNVKCYTERKENKKILSLTFVDVFRKEVMWVAPEKKMWVFQVELSWRIPEFGRKGTEPRHQSQRRGTRLEYRLQEGVEKEILLGAESKRRRSKRGSRA